MCDSADVYALDLPTTLFPLTSQLAKGSAAVLNFNEIENILTNFYDGLPG